MISKTSSGYKSPKWAEHRKAIREHSKDWQRIRCEFPGHHFIVGGDFSQARDNSGWYRDDESFHMLTEALAQARLACVTDQDMRKAGYLKNRASIDHICVSPGFEAKFSVWKGTTEEGILVSDIPRPLRERSRHIIPYQSFKIQ